MIPIEWSESALDDLAVILGYIGARNSLAAEALLTRIERAVLPTSDHPYAFPVGRVAGTREIVAHPNYIIVYRVKIDCIEVLSVLHSRQEYP